MSNKSPRFVYFSNRGGRQRQVTQEEWEREWLNWWKKSKNEEEESEQPS